MSTGGQKRKRSQRVAALELPPNRFERTLIHLRRRAVLVRIALCISAAVLMWALMAGWAPPFPYRTGYVPQRNIVVQTPFKHASEIKTSRAQEMARNSNQVLFVYSQDPRPLIQLRSALRISVVAIRDASELKDLDSEIWQEFLDPMAERPTVDELQRFHDALTSDAQLEAFDKAVSRAFAEIEQRGILEKLDQLPNEGSQSEIQVHPYDAPTFPIIVKVADVQRGEAITRLRNRLKKELASPEVFDRVSIWLDPKLKKMTTLKKDDDASKAEQQKAVDAVKEVFDPYNVGDRLAEAGKPLTSHDLQLLKLEYDESLHGMPSWQKWTRTVATFGMFLALYALCGFYIFYRERRLLTSIHRFSLLLGLVVVTVAVCLVASKDAWRAELIPLLLFGMTVSIAYHQELALLVSAAVALIVAFAIGHGLPDFVVLLSGAAAAILLLDQIRSRSKLIYVGLCAGAVAALTSIGVNILDNQPLNDNLLLEAGRVGGWAVLAGFLMTGLLPFIEKSFGVLTDISLLELGDVAHPLLQELVRRAPGTYNHSINVASIAEAAAESIGARGLLVRVGAYFHDIGKMLKPGYFAENQGQSASRHESLLPAMSTLIIIAHIKDGADLARQHHLPLPIIDFIQQHHGTTLVEYFYHRAYEQCEADPNGTTVDESAFRYPGPKPESKEAGVLMLADAVESASRVLVGPTPARIENLVHEIVMKRLLDRQFDSSGLTLQEVSTIEESLVKSLTAVYHGRVKYPDQRTA